MAVAVWLAAVALGPMLAGTSGSSGSPYYTADSIANTAASVAGFYAPNTFVTIYGTNLAYTTRALQASDIAGTSLPTVLGSTGVRVLINNILANIYYVSPTVVNILIPTSLTAGPATLQLVVDGLAGPAIPIMLGTAAPSFFPSGTDGNSILATHLDGSIVNSDAPAHAGEIVVLYASGLGPTSPPAIPDQIPQQAATIAPMSSFSVLLNGTPLDPQQILYAGVTPTYAGLFAVIIRLPDPAPTNPEVRVGYTNILSPAGRMLTLQ